MKTVLVLLASALFQLCSAQTDALDPGIGSETSFQLFGGFLIVIEGRIGSLSKLKFILDTGATRSVVDRKIVGKLRPRRRAHVFSFDKTISLEEGDFHDVQFGPVQLSQFSMLVGDLSYFSEFARDADGLIGMDFLGRTNFLIDYEANKVRFSRIEGSSSGFGSDPTSTCFTVEIRVQDRPVRLIVDTGLKGILLYEDRLRTRMPNLRSERNPEQVPMGRITVTGAILPDVRIGARNTEARVFLVKGPPGNILPGIDGYMGTAVLKARQIQFNFAASTLGWK